MQKKPYIRLDLWEGMKVSEELSPRFVLPGLMGCGDKGVAAHPPALLSRQTCPSELTPVVAMPEKSPLEQCCPFPPAPRVWISPACCLGWLCRPPDRGRHWGGCVIPRAHHVPSAPETVWRPVRQMLYANYALVNASGVQIKQSKAALCWALTHWGAGIPYWGGTGQLPVTPGQLHAG